MIPQGIVTTGWPQVEAKGLELGIGFDWWQCSLGRVVLGKRADGKYAATIGGVVLSIPRQVGKTYFVGALVIILCILFPGLQVVWTAHRTRTATRTFRSLQGMVKRKRVKPYLMPGRNDGIRTANGEQEIAFANGSMIMFGAREQGFGRGFDEVDIEVFDEAQILTEKALEDMVAATNQSRHPHGALLFYMGTPPRPVDPGEVFTVKRRKALTGTSEDMVYLECSADPDANPDDPAQWAKANFSYPHRTPHESMLRLRENLGTEEGWSREALGRWDSDDSGPSIFAPGSWPACLDERGRVDRSLVFAVAVTFDRTAACIGAAGIWDEDDDTAWTYVEPVEHAPGNAWVVPRAKQLKDKHERAVFVIDGGGPAKTLIDPLRDAGLVVQVYETQDWVLACAAADDAVSDRRAWRHRGLPVLENAVAAAQWRSMGDQKVLNRKSGDTTALETAILAAHEVTQIGQGVILW